MRPIRLELRGFTAFRDRSEVDFSQLGLFAITGPTGAGKTSLLDAITYALYGKTSRLNKAGKDLISQGAAGLWVEFDFHAGAGTYRVARVIKGSTVTVRLEKQQDGDWQGIAAGAGVSDYIRRIVGLDFDGFTKAVILPQGKFDVFLRGKPEERREVLNDLLDVGVYQRMMQSANEKAKLFGVLAKAKESEIDPVATPEARADRERELEGLIEREKSAGAVLDRLRATWPYALRLRDKRKAAADTEREIERICGEIAKALAAAKLADEEASRQRSALEELDRRIQQTAYDNELHLKLSQWEPLAKQNQDLRKQKEDQEGRKALEEAGLRAANEGIAAAKQLLESAEDQVRKADLSRVSKKKDVDDLKARHGSVDTIQHAISELEKARLAEPELAKQRGDIAKLESRGAVILGEFLAAQKAVPEAEELLQEAEAHYRHFYQKDQLKALRLGLQPGESCPVCEQTVVTVPAVTDPIELVKAEQNRKQAGAALKKAEEKLAKVKGEAEVLPGKIELARKQLEVSESAIRTAKQRASAILGAEADDFGSALGELIGRLQAAETMAGRAQSAYEKSTLAAQKASQELQDAGYKRQLVAKQIEHLDNLVASCNREIQKLDAALIGAPPLEEIASGLASLKAAKQKRDQLETARKTAENTLRQARELLVKRDADSASLEKERSKYAAAIGVLNGEIAEITAELREKLVDLELAGTLDEAAQIEQLQREKQKDHNAAQALVEQCRFAIQTLAAKIENNERLRGEAAAAKAEESSYSQLGGWLNAGNFQQFLLNSAFELLALEGSRHLKTLSNERYTFEYRDKEFVVVDKWHGAETRSANTLSGGESFLASLALALALAESIADLNSGSGAALESLFLDEGFSTLDNETLGSVADAIQLLQNGKRLIGIITHVTSLADQMPARIEVEKTLSGSRVLPAKQTARHA